VAAFQASAFQRRPAFQTGTRADEAEGAWIRPPFSDHETSKLARSRREVRRSVGLRTR